MIVMSDVKLADQQVGVIEDVMFHDGVFRNCRFTKLANVEFKDCTLESCDFSGMDLSSVAFKESFARKCDFQNILVCGDARVHSYIDEDGDLLQTVKGKSTFDGNQPFEGCDFRGALMFADQSAFKVLMNNREESKNDFRRAWLGGCLVEVDSDLTDASDIIQTVLANAICPEMNWKASLTSSDGSVATYIYPLDVGIRSPNLSRLQDDVVWTHHGDIKLWNDVSKAIATGGGVSGKSFESWILSAVKKWLTEQISQYGKDSEKYGDMPPLPFSDKLGPEDIAQAVTSIIMQQQAIYRMMNPSSPWFRD